MSRTDTAQLTTLRTEVLIWRALETAIREPVNVYAPAAADDGKGSSLPPGKGPQHANDSVLLPLAKD